MARPRNIRARNHERENWGGSENPSVGRAERRALLSYPSVLVSPLREEVKATFGTVSARPAESYAELGKAPQTPTPPASPALRVPNRGARPPPRVPPGHECRSAGKPSPSAADGTGGQAPPSPAPANRAATGEGGGGGRARSGGGTAVSPRGGGELGGAPGTKRRAQESPGAPPAAGLPRPGPRPAARKDDTRPVPG